MVLFSHEQAKELSEKISKLIEEYQKEGVKLGYQMTIVELDKDNPGAAILSNVANQVAYNIVLATVNVMNSQQLTGAQQADAPAAPQCEI